MELMVLVKSRLVQYNPALALSRVGKAKDYNKEDNGSNSFDLQGILVI